MSLLQPSVLQRLARRRLLVQRALASSGVGERRSRAKGVGIEFADHRPYQLGDDIRHLDRHVFARLGEHHVRQFSLYQQLSVTILLDASASMRFGQPDKFGFAKAVAAGLAYVALAGGDRVLVGAFSGDRLTWFSPLHGVNRAASLFNWLEQLEPHQTTNLPRVARLAVNRLRSGGLLVVVSDWVTPDLEAALSTFDLARQELVGVQVLAPEEEEPGLLGAGELRLVDAETGNEVDLSLEPALIERYREDLETWSREVRDAVRAHRGRFLRVRSDNDVERVLTHDWRKEGLIS